MRVLDIYSKRKKQSQQDRSEVFQYENIPVNLRIQIIHIIGDSIGLGRHSEAVKLYDVIHRHLCREYGVFSLVALPHPESIPILEALLSFNSLEPSLRSFDYLDITLDIIEISFRAIDQVVRRNPFLYGAKIHPDHAIDELNQRFLEHSVGYKFNDGKIMRIDSEYIHAEVVKPALTLLDDCKFSQTNAEFRCAHEYFNQGKYQECLGQCLKSFELAFKTICDQKGWQYGPEDTVGTLVDNCQNKQLVPEFLQAQFYDICRALRHSIPSESDRAAKPTEELESMAAYVLNLTATNISFLVKSQQEAG
ncbi:hypothetical protein Pse7367_0773 [Thalassoporum mexicanum PCC 7367]|uniref:STM4504/CBY_0614 family protein n=1 Tax=Thalassoporum mexicanum TaxID=3457544 RepID=UPI00029FAAFF|nr:hypothetical protein [Pseudanabaena sp. PCC 7367]AFY69074.1 hypothetical protein Pse7367_0773 [Pseudanabaena sp. PCC 7367]